MAGSGGLPSVGQLSPHKAALAPVHAAPPPPPAAGPDAALLTEAARPFTPSAPGKLSYMDDSEESDKTQESASAGSTEPSVVSTDKYWSRRLPTSGASVWGGLFCKCDPMFKH